LDLNVIGKKACEVFELNDHFFCFGEKVVVAEDGGNSNEEASDRCEKRS